MGWGSEYCTSRVIFEKNQYLPGEKAKVKIICDNSKCKKAVQSFKFKLKRKITIEGVSKDLGIDMTQNTTTNTYLTSYKFTGCKGKETVERDFEIDIPAVDTDVAKKPGITLLEEEIPLLTTISSSFSGRLFKVEYSLKFFVKHDSWDEFGEGTCVEMPVKIVQPAFVIIVPDKIKDPTDKIILHQEESKKELAEESKTVELEQASPI